MSLFDKKHLEILPIFVFLFTTTPSLMASYINKTRCWAKSQGVSYQRTTLAQHSWLTLANVKNGRSSTYFKLLVCDSRLIFRIFTTTPGRPCSDGPILKFSCRSVLGSRKKRRYFPVLFQIFSIGRFLVIFFYM